MRRSLVAIALFASLLSGCTEPEADVQALAQEPLPFDSRPLAQAVANATDDAPAAPALTRDDWLVLPLQATASGTVAGYRFPVPEGALVPAWYDEDQKELALEFAIIGDGDVQILHVLVGQEGAVLAESTGFADAAMGGAGVNEKSFSSLSGDFLFVEAKEGKEAFVVVGALGSGDATIGVRFLREDPFAAAMDGRDFEFPAADGKQFLEKVGDRQGTYVTPVAQADGLHVGLLYEHYSFVLPSWTQVIVGEIEVEQPLPATPVQPVTLIDAAAGSGPGYASGTIWTWTEAHTGFIDARISTPDGKTTATSGPIVPDPIVQSTVVLASGEGDKDGALSFSMQAAGTPVEFPQLIVVAYVGFDATLSTLAGEAVEARSTSHDAIPLVAGGHAYLRGPAGTTSLRLPA